MPKTTSWQVRHKSWRSWLHSLGFSKQEAAKLAYRIVNYERRKRKKFSDDDEDGTFWLERTR